MSLQLLAPIETEQVDVEEDLVEPELPDPTASAFVFGCAPEVETKVAPSATARVAAR